MVWIFPTSFWDEHVLLDHLMEVLDVFEDMIGQIFEILFRYEYI